LQFALLDSGTAAATMLWVALEGDRPIGQLSTGDADPSFL